MSAERSGNTAVITFEDDTWKTAAPDVFTVSDGSTPFFSSALWTLDGKNTLRSGSITHSGTSETIITATLVEAGSIALKYIVSSEGNFDKLHVLIDGTEVVTASGISVTSFTEYRGDLASGEHVITLRYTKDGSASAGNDACAIGSITLAGVAPPYMRKYLMSDFDGKIYTIIDGVVTEIAGAALTDLGEKAFFELNGTDDKPTSAQILSLTRPVIYRWSDGDTTRMKAVVTAVPKPQVISAVADLSHETILGITEMTAVYEGTVTVSYSYDGSTYTDPVAIADFLAFDKDALYNGASDSKKIYMKFTITGKESSLTNFVITYLNPDD